MKKRQAITLSIPNPCHVGWENMAATEKGRHCTSCNKTVIDFSNYTDKELADFFKSSNGRVCGRVSKFQLDRVIATPTNKRFPFLNKLAWGTAIASWLGLTSTVSAQNNNDTTTVQQKNKKADSIKSKQSDDNGIIWGTLVNSKTNESIPFANVILETKDDKVQLDATVTDIDGKFKLNTSAQFIGQDLTILSVYAGYSDSRYKLQVKKGVQSLTIKLEPNGREVIRDYIIIGSIVPQSFETPDNFSYHRGDNPYLAPKPHN